MASDTYRRRLDAGLCGRCGRRPPRPGLASCAQCGAEVSERVCRRKRERVAAGVCPTCRRPGYAPRPRKPRQGRLPFAA